MAFWLVYQGDSYERSRAGGYLWAPQLGRRNQRQQYWTNLTLVESGDIIFSGVDGAVRAVSVAEGPAVESTWPDPRDQRNWEREGWRLNVTYLDLPRPLPYAEWVPIVRSELTYRNSPFDFMGEPNQGFLYSLPDVVGELLTRLGSSEGVDVALETTRRARFAEQPTQKEAVINARIGQGQFRRDLLNRWLGKCPLSGVDRPELLRASHIKPWAACNNRERLDTDNGVLLSAAYDAAFDAKLITFDTAGNIVLAADFAPSAALRAGIKIDAKLAPISDGMEPYLAVHRELLTARVQLHMANDPASLR